MNATLIQRVAGGWDRAHPKEMEGLTPEQVGALLRSSRTHNLMNTHPGEWILAQYTGTEEELADARRIGGMTESEIQRMASKRRTS